MTRLLKPSTEAVTVLVNTICDYQYDSNPT